MPEYYNDIYLTQVTKPHPQKHPNPNDFLILSVVCSTKGHELLVPRVRSSSLPHFFVRGGQWAGRKERERGRINNVIGPVIETKSGGINKN
ncbi:hypothetical protein F2P81_024914 [Scophthalmus maximus]|uniref:Uncharacterized protein n=1 Tax=Scophthalmus maximus TaxID=52904 RepID=A0A6A4RM54_SCOMX|nr:hypothetical protein F2P81_024914 [Scophthalmus maximus]